MFLINFSGNISCIRARRSNVATFYQERATSSGYNVGTTMCPRFARNGLHHQDTHDAGTTKCPVSFARNGLHHQYTMLVTQRSPRSLPGPKIVLGRWKVEPRFWLLLRIIAVEKTTVPTHHIEDDFLVGIQPHVPLLLFLKHHVHRRVSGQSLVGERKEQWWLWFKDTFTLGARSSTPGRVFQSPIRLIQD